jgi:hypothetical protein
LANGGRKSGIRRGASWKSFQGEGSPREIRQSKTRDSSADACAIAPSRIHGWIRVSATKSPAPRSEGTMEAAAGDEAERSRPASHPSIRPLPPSCICSRPLPPFPHTDSPRLAVSRAGKDRTQDGTPRWRAHRPCEIQVDSHPAAPAAEWNLVYTRQAGRSVLAMARLLPFSRISHLASTIPFANIPATRAAPVVQAAPHPLSRASPSTQYR